MSDDVRELIAEVNELISEFEAIWGIGKRSENLRVMERLADAIEATLQPTTITDEMVRKVSEQLEWHGSVRSALEAALGGGNDE